MISQIIKNRLSFRFAWPAGREQCYRCCSSGQAPLPGYLPGSGWRQPPGFPADFIQLGVRATRALRLPPTKQRSR